MDVVKDNIPETPYMEDHVNVNFPCENCPKMFDTLTNLKQHVRRFHKVITLLQCFHCKYQTRYKACLTRHISVVHRENKRKLKTYPERLKCPLCGTELPSRDPMIDHYNDVHGVDTKGVVFNFDNKADFEFWKENIELEDKCRFILCNGPKIRKDAIKRRYTCFRDGFFIKRGNGQRAMKLKGSIKIDAVCPASIRTEQKKNTGEIRVTYINTHVGHNEEVGWLSLRKTERAEIAQQLASGIPYQQVLDSIHKSFDGNLRRLHLINLKDIHNIKASFNLGAVKGVTPKTDCNSVDAWIRTMKNISNVRFYKPEGKNLPSYPELLNEDMVLVIASNEQIEMLKMYGSDMVCLEGTNGLNSYNIQLTSLMVLGKQCQAIPCAYMFSNRTDTQIMTIFARVMKSMLPEPLPINAFISDLSGIYVQGWSAVMPLPKKVLFCSWHVDHDWKTNLTKIEKIDRRSHVHKMLKDLLFEADDMVFWQQLETFLVMLDGDQMTADFCTYFRKVYSTNLEQWACCFRTEKGFNFNVCFENMHKVLMYIYLGDRKTSKSLDKTISTLLRLTQDKCFDQLIDIKPDELASKIDNIRTEHETSLSMESNIVTCKYGWVITSESEEEVYFIQKTGVTSCVCQLKCEECDICIHTFKCGCVDYVVEARICRHIHKVRTYVESESDSPGHLSEMEDEISMDDLISFDAEGNHIEEVIIETQLVPVQDLNEKISQIRNVVDEILRNVHCDEHADIVLNALRPVLPTMQAHSTDN